MKPGRGAKGNSEADRHEREQAINREYQDLINTVLGPDAAQDYQPPRKRIRNPTGGVVVLADPGDLEDPRYVKRTPREALESASLALAAVKSIGTAGLLDE